MATNYVAVDTSQLKEFGKVLHRASPELEKEFRKALVAAGELVAADARSRASFSTKIPASIKVKRRANAVKVVAGGDAAPEAAALEHGGVQGTFRHPVFGDPDVWVDQPAQPFLTPALEAKSAEFLAETLVAVDVALAKLGI